MPSSNIDKRIVEMDFDNQRFERNVNQSISTLDKLKNALNLNDAAKGFNQLEKQANSVNFSGLERSISNIEHRFSALGIAGATIVNNLTNKAIGAVSKLNNAVFGQMKSGGINRALNLEHANFMMQGLLKDANKVAEIMASDGPVQKSVRGTAYGLDEAAGAAAQFLASGVQDLGKLEDALTGISGVAAMTGSSFSDIASIFTTVAGQGKVMTMQLRQLEARSLNPAATLAEQLHKSEAEIRDMVTKGKIDFETFAEAMNSAFGDQAKKANETFTGAMSNVKAALSRIGAKVAAPTIEEIRKIFVDLISVVDGVSKALDPLIDDINIAISTLSEFSRSLLENEELVRVYTNAIELLRNIVGQVVLFVAPIKEAFTDIFPPRSLKQIADVLELFKNLTSVFYLSEESSSKLRRIFRGLFSIFDIVGQAIEAIVMVMLTYSKEIGTFVSNMLEAAAKIGDFFTGLSMWIRENNLFYNSLMSIINIIANFKTFAINSINEIKRFFDPFINSVKNGIDSIISSVSNLNGSVSIIDKIKERLSSLTSIGKVFGAVFEGIKAVFKEMSPIFKAFAEYIGNGITTLFTGIAEVIHSGRGFEGLLDLINTVLIGGIGAGIAGFIDQIVNITKKSNTLIGNISWTFKELANSLSVFQAKIKADMLASIAKSVGILTLSIIGLSLIDSDKLTKALMAITVLMGVLAGARIALAKFIPVAEMAGKTWYEKLMNPFSQTMQMAAQYDSLLKLAGAIGILALSLKLLSTIKDEDMTVALGGFIVMVGGFVATAILLDKYTKQLPDISNSFLMLSASMFILSKALQGLSKQKPENVLTSMLALSAMLAGISVALSKVQAPKGGDLLVTAGAISMIALAIGSLAPGLALLSAMDPVGVAVGMGSLAAMIFAISEALNRTKGQDLLVTAGAISMIALAIGSLAPGLSLMAAMDPLNVALGVAALATMLLAIGVALTKIKGPDLMQTAGAITLVAFALNTLAPTLAMLGVLPWQVLAKGLGTIAIALVAIGGAAFLFQKAQLGPMLIILGQSMLMISGSVALVGAGLLMIGTALGIIGVTGAAAAVSISAIMAAIGGALPTLLAGLAAGIAAFIIALGAAAGSIGIAVGQIAKAALKALEMIIPEFIKLVSRILVAIIQAINDIVPAVVETVLNIIDSVLASIQAHVGNIIESLTLILIEIIEGLAYSIENYSGILSDAIIHLFTVVFDILIAEVLPKFLNFGLDIIGKVLEGLWTAAGELLKFVVELGGELLKALGVPEDWVDKGVELINGFIDGVISNIKAGIDAVVEFGKGIIDAVCKVFDINSPSKIFEWIGEMCNKGAEKGIENNQDGPIGAVETMGNGMIGMLDDKLSTAETVAEGHANNLTNILDRVNKTLYGITSAQRKAAKAEDTKRSDMMGYNNIDALTRAGQAGLVKVEHQSKDTTKALNAETSALTGKGGGGNTGATKKNTKAKEENAKANEKKTKSIDEESEALNEETEAAAENEEEIRALAEQIEVVTEAYNTSLDTIGRADKFKMVKKQAQVMSDFWSKGLKGDGAWKTVQDVYRAYKAIDNSALTTTKVFKKGVYAYKESGKYLKKYKDTLLTSSKEIEKKVLKTGNTLAKVTNGQAKMFYKNGNTVEKMTIRLTKRAKNLGKQFAEARAFATALSQENISEKVLNTEKIEDFVYPLRKIQDLFVSRGSMPKAVQDYLGTIRYKLLELNDSMNMLAKNIDGVGSTWKSSAQNTAYVQDAFLSLAASLYDGSEAANEYATEQARLEFLMEHGLATEEEVAEHRESYISRITKALVEYKNTLQETLQGSLDVWKEFDTKEEDAKTDFIKTIESQLAGYRQWSDMLMELSKRGLSFDIQRELTEAGVESFGKLKSLLSMTREELALFMVDYQQSQTAAERAANLAVAALANARTQATARAAEKSGKITQKQINESRKAAREIANNNKALARDQAIYHSMTKKQEQDYLKTLTKRQRAEYKAEKKAEKKLQKEREVLAEQERARRAEKERVDGVLASIKTLDDYFKMAEQYVKDTGVMTRMTEEMTKAFEPFKEDIKNITTYTGDATDAFMIFAETLDATGTEGLNYFEELAARVEKFKKEITDAVKNVSYLTTEFTKSSKMTTDTLYKNLYSNLVADTKAVYLMNQLSGKGYNQYVITDAINKWKSDRAAGLEYINTLVEAGQADVEAYNAALEEQVRLSAQIASSATSASASTVTRDQINQEIKRREEAVRKAQSEEESAVKRVDEVRTQLESTYAAKAEYDRKQLQIADEKARKKELKQKLKDTGKLSKAEEKEYKNLLKKYGGSYKGVNYFAQEMFEIVNYQWEIDTLTNELTIAQNEYGKALENTAEKQRLLNEEYSVLYDYENKIKKATEALTKKVNLRIWFEKAAQSVDGLVNSMKALNKESDEYKYAQGEIARVLKDFSGAIATYNVAGNFENIKKAAKGLKDPISNIEYGLLKFGETLIDVTNDTEEFFDALLKGLAEYQASLKSAIQSSSDFFSMFDGFKDKDNPLTATDYLEYADSQIKALNVWQDNLKKLADKGLDQQILEKFASQGLSSYEMVNAWANATSRQIGEYNDQWRRYNETVEKATNSALASIGAAGSKAGQAIQDAMVDAFRKGGAERIAKELTDAADLATTTKMIVTGIADGMSNAMPTIAKVAKDTGKVISTSLASPEVVSSITTSLGGTVSTATTTATSDMVNNFKMAVNSVNNLIDTEMNLHPVITPTVDTSRFDEAIARMNAAISNVQANAANASAAVEAARQSSTTNNNSSTTNNTTNVTFNQTNNSPKALDQVEIYRQTHNATVSMSGMIVGGQWR